MSCVLASLGHELPYLPHWLSLRPELGARGRNTCSSAKMPFSPCLLKKGASASLALPLKQRTCKCWMKEKKSQSKIRKFNSPLHFSLLEVACIPWQQEWLTWAERTGRARKAPDEVLGFTWVPAPAFLPNVREDPRKAWCLFSAAWVCHTQAGQDHKGWVLA